MHTDGERINTDGKKNKYSYPFLSFLYQFSLV
jgi:hypothetical protein